ncbi:MAG: M48 family metalloprotease [Theionarchaea archaeon]|nr:M48 family metalloprotease [Theionarchaea archaeon]
MNEWQNLALAVLLVVVAEIANEITIAVFRVKNATTRFRIRLISLFSCFFVFLALPLKMVELTILGGNTAAGENSLYLLGGPVVLASRLSRFAWVSIVLVVIAASCFIIMLLFSGAIISRLLHCEPTSDPRLLALVKEVSRELKVKVDRVMICKKKCDAFVYGYPPALAVGSDLLRILNDEELRIVIRHELYHVKGRDTLIKPLVTALCIMFIYNPMVWFLSSKLAADRECHADRRAITSSHDARTFLCILLKFHDLTHGIPHSLAVHWIGSTSRVDSLFLNEKTRKIPVLVCLFLTFSSLFVGGSQLFEERYVEIEGNSLSFDSVVYHSDFADLSEYFVDIPLAEWYQRKNSTQQYVSIPLQESELLELLKISKYSNGGVTIRLAILPLWRRRQLFGGPDYFGFSANCHIIVHTDDDGNPYIIIEKVPTEPEQSQIYG